jgi:predicted NAD-dependent protein-ADP-ribosyltransferase YbiA (DUF1768 family)
MDNRPDIAEGIRTVSKSPAKAKKYAEARRTHQHPDWNRSDRFCIAKVRAPLKITLRFLILGQQLQMEIAVWHKFSQNPELKRELLGTGDAELVVRKSS